MAFQALRVATQAVAVSRSSTSMFTASSPIFEIVYPIYIYIYTYIYIYIYIPVYCFNFHSISHVFPQILGGIPVEKASFWMMIPPTMATMVPHFLYKNII